MDEYLTVKQAADLLKTSRQKITKLIENGYLPAKDISLGKERCNYRIKKSDIDKLDVA